MAGASPQRSSQHQNRHSLSPAISRKRESGGSGGGGSSRRKTKAQGSGPCRRLRVVLLGDMRVGKTSILQRFVEGRFDPRVSRTIEIAEMEKEVVVDNQRYVLRVVDTCGGERFRSLRENFYRGTNVCLLTFALDNLSSFCNLTMWREEFLYYSDVPMGREFPFLVIGNKADVAERAVSDLNAGAWCRANGDVPYFETSAKEALNVQEVFEAAVKRYEEVASMNSAVCAGVGSLGRDRSGVIQDLGEGYSPGDAEQSKGCCG